MGSYLLLLYAYYYFMPRTIYVIKLDESVLNEPSFRKYNPQYKEGKKCYYVGESGYTPERRFEIHKNRIKTNNGYNQHNEYVAKYGLCLTPRQYQKIPTYRTSVEAKLAEKETARRLMKRGHAVYCDKGMLKEILEEESFPLPSQKT